MDVPPSDYDIPEEEILAFYEMPSDVEGLDQLFAHSIYIGQDTADVHFNIYRVLDDVLVRLADISGFHKCPFDLIRSLSDPVEIQLAKSSLLGKKINAFTLAIAVGGAIENGMINNVMLNHSPSESYQEFMQRVAQGGDKMKVVRRKTIQKLIETLKRSG